MDIGDDDDGSELTELREAQEALFPLLEGGGEGSESVVSSEVSSEIESQAAASIGTSTKALSSLDIVPEESPQYHQHHEQQQQQQAPLSPVREGSDGEQTMEERRNDLDISELDELPSAAKNDPSKKSVRGGKTDDDSVSYSDIDADSHANVAPSIKMCMTVRDSLIEREFDTAQLIDVEFGDQSKRNEVEMLLEGMDDVENPIDDSMRSNDSTIITQAPRKNSLVSKSADLRKSVATTMDTKATRHLRHRNKRLWKACVWNWRKITVCFLLSLCVIVGGAVLVKWGVSKMSGDDDDNIQAGSESNQLPPGSGQLPLEAVPSQVPSLMPSQHSGVDGIVSASTPTSTPSVSMQPIYGLRRTNPPTPSPTFSSSPTIVSSKNKQSLRPSSSSSILDLSKYPSISPSPSSENSTVANASIPFTYSSSSPPSNPTSNTSTKSNYESTQIISGDKAFEYAGSSVAMTPKGDFFSVGFKEASGPAERTGAVRVYHRNVNNSYSPIGLDRMFGKETGDEFGSSVSMSNDGQRVAVGARSSSSLPDKKKNGEVTVFEYSQATNSWAQLGSAIKGLDEIDRFGWSVSMSGDGNRVAAGAPKGNGGTGSASIHEYNGLDWISSFDDILVGINDDDRAGFSVALSNDGTTLAVGAYTSSNSGLTNSGSVTVYRIDGFNWIVQGQTLGGVTDGAHFGYSVALSGDGMRLVVGSNGFHAGNMTKTGLCEVFEFLEENSSWVKIGGSLGDDNEEAGSHVSISTDGNIFSCSKRTSVDGVMIGAVVVLGQNGTDWGVIDTVISSFENSTSFGTSASLSEDGKMLLVGAPAYNSSAGYVELFTWPG